MSVTLRKRKNADNTTSLILDIYHNGKRSYEFLKDLKLKTKPAEPADRKKNKENLELAESIRNKRAQELVSLGYDVVASFKSNADFIEYFDAYIKKYTKKDKRNMEGAFNRFKDFMEQEGIKSLTMSAFWLIQLYVNDVNHKCTCVTTDEMGRATFAACDNSFTRQSKKVEKITEYFLVNCSFIIAMHFFWTGTKFR